MFINNFGMWWLGGVKYQVSAGFAGNDWTYGVEGALREHKLSLEQCKDIHDVVRVFHGRYFWKPDGIFQLQDTVLPPRLLLRNGGDDCDGWAMTHAQAVNHALKKYGWKAVIVSYLADPWTVSHHFAAVTDPQGRVWAMQPQPTKEQWDRYGSNCQVVFGPYATIREATDAVAGMYNAKAVWADVRDDMYRPLYVL